MRVLVLGATGSIGTAVAAVLHANGHTVIALARSHMRKSELEKLGYQTVFGDIRQPKVWSKIVHEVDAIVHVAATFTDDMGEVDRGLIEELESQASIRAHPMRFVYTGGCWLYGATGNRIATEESPINTIGPFTWAVENPQFLLDSTSFVTAIIHPAMVYHPEGGVFTSILQDIANKRPIKVYGNKNTRWTLVHRNDLATAFLLLLEQDALVGHFNASAEIGVPIGQIASSIAERAAADLPLVEISLEDAVSELGSWAEGLTLDQQMASPKLEAAGWVPVFTDYSTVKMDVLKPE